MIAGNFFLIHGGVKENGIGYIFDRYIFGCISYCQELESKVWGKDSCFEFALEDQRKPLRLTLLADRVDVSSNSSRSWHIFDETEVH